MKSDCARLQWLEAEFQAQLNGPGASRADNWIGRCYVRCDAATAKWWRRWIVETEAILSAIRIGEVWVVENVEEFGAKLGVKPFPELPVLRKREIPVAEAGIVKRVTAHSAERSKRRRKHHRTALCVAPKPVERGKLQRARDVRTTAGVVDGKCRVGWSQWIGGRRLPG